MTNINNEISVQCPFCFETLNIVVDVSGGLEQQYVYDCEVCCRPIEMRVEIDDEGNVNIDAQRES